MLLVMKSFDVVIIDSGFNDMNCLAMSGVSIKKNKNGFTLGNNLKDRLGHGTIIHTIICKKTSFDKIFCVKMPDNETEECNATSLIFALEYIKQNVNCKIINISLGIKTDCDLKGLYDVCKELALMGIVIVSAFDNEGCNSYPAAFDCVIGVDSKNDIGNIDEIDYVEDSPINIFSKGSIQRIKMNDGRILLVGGASIACAYVTSMLIDIIDKGVNLQFALSYLKEKARYIYSSPYKEKKSNKLPFQIRRAIIFPFNKESHAFLRFKDILSFEIAAFYDIRQSGNVGRKLNRYYEGENETEIIRNVENIDFDGIDTLILGHLDELNFMTKKDYREDVIKKAIEANVNIYSFDPLVHYEKMLLETQSKFYYPMLTQKDIPLNAFGKLYKIAKPVVGIFGTSSKQGKFSLQIALKNELEKRNYCVGTIGTEPHSLLFGFDAVFPMGYNSTIYLDNNEIVLYLNNEINKLCFEGKEIVLIASQAQTIPYYCNNLLEFPSMQYHFALGTNPDAIVLCINYHDEKDYIRNTIYTLMGLVDSMILGLVLYPITFSSEWNGVYGNSKYIISQQEYEKKAKELENEFDIPVYMLGNQEHLEDLCQSIIDFF